MYAPPQRKRAQHRVSERQLPNAETDTVKESSSRCERQSGAGGGREERAERDLPKGMPLRPGKVLPGEPEVPPGPFFSSKSITSRMRRCRSTVNVHPNLRSVLPYHLLRHYVMSTINIHPTLTTSYVSWSQC